eukprot:CAMPEP_0201595358 /NCGR_PEP_ID=MMETSP0190_2-20130828/192381_1 /ASSEMBLY_ACC=CAM_ASM_000263 /TAXON_ID=37353 /ORGANISM="Rosalina sp." /LENGTH=302 /DNA_ID=CAMNT_0048055303 /DNA_START=469 /DNA_END=1377 /DNA_ORIENTATION=-
MVVFAFMHYRAFPWWEFKYRKIPIDKVGYGYTNFGGLDDVTNSAPNSPKDKDKHRDRDDGQHKTRVNSNSNSNDNDNDNDFEYRKFSAFGYDEEEKELEDDNNTNKSITTDDNQYHDKSQGHKRSIDEPEIEEEFSFGYNSNNLSTKNEVLEQNKPKRKRRKSSENLAIISEEIITFKSWCSAFLEVINVFDVCNDVKDNFVTPASSMISEMGLNQQKSYDEYNDDDENDIDHVQQAIQDGNISLDGSSIKRSKRKNRNNMLNTTLLLDETNISLSTKEKRKNEYIKDSQQMNIELLTVSSS